MKRNPNPLNGGYEIGKNSKDVDTVFYKWGVQYQIVYISDSGV
jgi:hypothetical protein